MQIQNCVHDHAALPAERSAPADAHEDKVNTYPSRRPERYHLIVAFSDQMVTPQTRFFGTREAAKRAGRRFANQHLKRAKHTHRHIAILDEVTGKQYAVALN